MTDNIALKEKIDRALSLAHQLTARYSNSLSFAQVVDQLNYLEQIYGRDGNFRSAARQKLTIGLIAAKEYDTSQPEFANLLYDINAAVDKAD